LRRRGMVDAYIEVCIALVMLARRKRPLPRPERAGRSIGVS